MRTLPGLVVLWMAACRPAEADIDPVETHGPTRPDPSDPFDEATDRDDDEDDADGVAPGVSADFHRLRA